MRSRAILLVTLLLVLSSCSNNCSETVCDEPEIEQIDGLIFKIDQELMHPQDLPGLKLVRYVKGEPDEGLDTLNLEDYLDENWDFHLTNTTPFNDEMTYDAYDYCIINETPPMRYSVSELIIEGEYPDYCCCCYVNLVKTMVINRQVVDLSGTEATIRLF